MGPSPSRSVCAQWILFSLSHVAKLCGRGHRPGGRYPRSRPPGSRAARGKSHRPCELGPGTPRWHPTACKRGVRSRTSHPVAHAPTHLQGRQGARMRVSVRLTDEPVKPGEHRGKNLLHVGGTGLDRGFETVSAPHYPCRIWGNTLLYCWRPSACAERPGCRRLWGRHCHLPAYVPREGSPCCWRREGKQGDFLQPLPHCGYKSAGGWGPGMGHACADWLQGSRRGQSTRQGTHTAAPSGPPPSAPSPPL